MISNYGVEDILLEYASLEKHKNYMPILAGYDHGWSMREFKGVYTTLQRKISSHLVWNKRTYENLSKHKKKNPYIVSNFFKIYKEKNKIKKEPKNKSIFFLAHSTNKIRADQDIFEICKKLENLPKIFHPIDICMTEYDKINNKHFNFGNFKICSAGNAYSNNYVKNFYDLIKSYKYALSNQPGTYLLNCVDLGIPFSLIGKEPVHINHGKDVNVPDKYKISQFEFGEHVYKLFKGLNLEISFEQKKLVNDEMGYDDRISPNELRDVLLDDLKKTFVNKEYFKRLVIEYVKRPYGKIFF
jgi:hypothetical protein